MAAWRILGAIGRTLITLGILLLLFVAYQLWGTGIQESRAQDNLESDFLELLDEFAEVADTAPPASLDEALDTAEDTVATADDVAATPDTPDSGDEVAATDVTVSEEEVEEAPKERVSLSASNSAPVPASFLYKEDGEAMARILIDKINVDKVVVAGTSVEPLRLGPGHYNTTVFPGQPGNAAIAGHRTTYGAPFHNIDKLEPGDEIKVQTLQGVHVYEVNAHPDVNGNDLGYFIVDPSATEVLADYGDNRLTLTACHPKYSAEKRIIVTATLISDTVELVPREDDGRDNQVALQTDEEVDDSEATGLPDQILSDEVAIDDDPSVTLNEDGEVVPVDGSDDTSDTGDNGDTDGETDRETETAASLTTDEGEPTGTDAGASQEAGQQQAAQDSALQEVAMQEATVPVAADAEEDFGEGLNGDSAAILPSITWALAAGFIWLAAWFVGTKWRKWPMYAMGIVPFALTMWLCFVHIDQAIPSY